MRNILEYVKLDIEEVASCLHLELVVGLYMVKEVRIYLLDDIIEDVIL